MRKSSASEYYIKIANEYKTGKLRNVLATCNRLKVTMKRVQKNRW